VQGTGFTIVALHPSPGSKARLIVADKKLTGCAALALDNLDTIWATAFSATRGTTDSDTKIYFNDDNDNDLQMLER
jgi:hypothetical protein